MSKNIFNRFKDWITDEESDEEEVAYEDESVELEMQEEEEASPIKNPSRPSKKVVNLNTRTDMKVMIVEPKKYEDVTIIADYLRENRSVIVNLEGLAQDVDTRKSIFYFMNGAVYVLDGSIRKISKAIFVLAPNNVEIDAEVKKELESKAFFPWQK